MRDMVRKIQEVSSGVLGSLGITISVQDMNQVVNLVLLVLSVVNILWILASRIIEHVKNKEYNKITDDIEDAKSDLEELKKKGQ